MTVTSAAEPAPAAQRMNGTLTVTRMFVVELARRWPSVLFMIFMPASYFLVSYLTTAGDARVPDQVWTGDGHQTVNVLDRDLRAIYLAVLGTSVTSSFAALTTVRSSMGVMRRLRLAGYRAGQLLSARLLVLLLITALSTAVFMAIFVPLVNLQSVLIVTGAFLLVGLIGVAIGTLVGLVVPREFEAFMLVVAIAGVQMALGRGDSSAEEYMPYTPAIDAMKAGAFTRTGDLALQFGQGLVYVAVVFGLVFAVWNLRTRVWKRGERP
ncbi:ABC transporter permease [Actinomadura rugatobispora]|uniref:ABC transporter permease n=1 Tax=Actinomadura rugatobispora TaxID=1994 RepID=A0ABW1AFF9_9ACTN|nr:hypothetical protein GCM10010200_020170 [Actinomadura rugatobispora]